MMTDAEIWFCAGNSSWHSATLLGGVTSRCHLGAKVVDAEWGAPCHTVPLDSIAVSLQGALSARSLLAQSGPLEYAEEALHW